MADFGHVKCEYLQPLFSDHSPLILHVCDDKAKVGKPFQFFNYMAEHANFDTLIKENWEVPVATCNLQHILDQLKRIKSGLKELHKNEFAHITQIRRLIS
jgi:hypothetical protein